MKASTKTFTVMLFAALALTVSLGLYCGLDAAFILALEDVKRYPRRFPAESALAAFALLMLISELWLIFRRPMPRRRRVLMILAAALLSVPLLYLWERASMLV